ncbi:hypothetical protein MMC10_004514 [Thelotrema lepadinum]|nr:hypothetical protein [Thelotrema lepadinum]
MFSRRLGFPRRNPHPYRSEEYWAHYSGNTKTRGRPDPTEEAEAEEVRPQSMLGKMKRWASKMKEGVKGVFGRKTRDISVNY